MIWISVKEAADLLGYVERTVQKKASDNEVTYRYIRSNTGRGGKKIEILLESLPEAAIKAYYNKSAGESHFVINTEYTSTKKQKEKGVARAEAVAEYKRFKRELQKSGITKEGEIRALFIAKWNEEHEDFNITSKSLYDWQKKTKSGNVDKLTDRRGGYNRGQSHIPEKYAKRFEKLYLQESKPSISSCYTEIKAKATIDGDYIPGIKAFRNYVRNLNPALLKRYRGGLKAFTDDCAPHSEMDYSQLKPNDKWVSDHHIWDIFVRVPDNKGGWRVVRPWGSYWMDMRSRKVVSSILRIDAPNGDVVLASFGLGIKHFGVPKGVILDNGKDYKSKDLFFPEGKHLEESENIATSLAANLDIDVTYAIPYNAKAKPIERMFNTFEEQLGKKYPSYAGSNAKNRPEDLKDLDVMEYITLEEFIAQHNTFVYNIYNENPHSGEGMFGMSPNKVYSSIKFTLRKANKYMLHFCLMRVKGYRTIGRNGITFNNIHYYNDNCIKYFNKKVLVKYDPVNPDLVYIFDKDENFLFIATKIEKMSFNPSEDDYLRENNRKKLAKQIVLNEFKKDNRIRSTESISERLNLIADGIEKAPISKQKNVSIVRNEKIEENIKRLKQSDFDREYADNLSRIRQSKAEITQKQKELGDKFRKKMLDLAWEKQA